MKNRSLVSGIVVLILFFTAFYFFEQKSVQTPVNLEALKQRESISPNSSAPLPAHIANSILAQLRPDLAYAVSIFPSKASPIADHLNKVKQALTESNLWKKNNADAMLDKVGKQAEELAQQKVASDQAKNIPPFDLLNHVAKNWRSFSELSFVVSSQFVNLTPEISLPKVMLLINSDSEAILAEIENWLKTKLPFANKADNFQLSIENLAAQQHKYQIALKFNDQFNLSASLEFQPKRVSILFNTENASDFFASAGSPRLIDSAKWKSVQPTYQNSTVAFYAADVAKVKQVINAFLSAKPVGLADNSKIEAALLGQRDSAEGQALSQGQVTLGTTLGISSCSMLNSGSWLEQQYKDFFQAAGAGAAPSGFDKLIDDGTFFALHLSGQSVRLAANLLTHAYSQKTIADVSSDPEIKRILDALHKHSDLLFNFPFKGISLLLSAPKMAGFGQVAYILMQADAAPPSAYLQKIKELINDVWPQTQFAQISQSADGSQQLTLEISPQFKFIARQLSDGSVLFADSEAFFKKVPALLSAQNGFVDKLSVDGKPLAEMFRSTSFATYFAVKSLFEVGKMLLGFAAMARPDLKLDPQDVDDALKPLEFVYVSTQDLRPRSDNVMCSESLWALADLKE